jgi:hypothetical protein
MVRWKEKDTDACPRCGEFEDAPHVWRCSGQQENEIRDKALDRLTEWMQEHKTNLDVHDTVLQYLNSRRYGTSCTNVPYGLQEVINQQQQIGWQPFLEGWLALEWQATQQAYYNMIKSRHSRKRWTAEIISMLWDVAWDLWEHRNSILHHRENLVSSSEQESLNQKVRSKYQQLQQLVLQTDRYLLRVAIDELLEKDVIYKRCWLSQATSALARIRIVNWDRHQQRAGELEDMKWRLRTWLNGQL